MTPEEFAEEMVDIKARHEGDTEAMHSVMDAFLCRALTELGYVQGILIYESVERWCA